MNKPSGTAPGNSVDYFDRFFKMVERRTGISVSPRQRVSLKKVVEERRAALPDADRQGYLSSLALSPVSGELWDEILGHLTVGETYFFRDTSQMEALRGTILPSIIEKNRDIGSLSILSAGCATGEEPYTLAMIIREILPDIDKWDVRIMATDINPKMLEAAGRACFREWSFRNTEPRVRAKYFSREKDLYALKPEIVKMVSFRRLNLVEDDVAALFPGMDMILCRNVVVYLCDKARRSVVNKLWQSLAGDGWLILGASEGMAVLSQEDATTHSFPGALAYRKQGNKRIGRSAGARQEPQPAAFALTEEAIFTDYAEEKPAPSAPPEAPPPLFRAEAKAEAPEPGPQPDPDTEFELSEVQRLADSGKVAEASSLLSGILEKNPNKAEAHFLSGILAMARRDIPAAAEHLKNTIFLSSGLAVAHGLLADLYRKAGMNRLARRHYGWALSLVEAAEPESIVSFSGGLSAKSMAELFRASLAETKNTRP